MFFRQGLWPEQFRSVSKTPNPKISLKREVIKIHEIVRQIPKSKNWTAAHRTGRTFQKKLLKNEAFWLILALFAVLDCPRRYFEHFYKRSKKDEKYQKLLVAEKKLVDDDDDDDVVANKTKAKAAAPVVVKVVQEAAATPPEKKKQGGLMGFLKTGVKTLGKVVEKVAPTVLNMAAKRFGGWKFELIKLFSLEKRRKTEICSSFFGFFRFF